MPNRIAALIVAATTVSAVHVAHGQSLEGSWAGVAALRPDSGLPVSLRLRIDRPGDSLRVKLSLPESQLIDLELPSPYSDSSYATFKGRHLHAEFTPDIGLAFIGRIVKREDERIVFDGDLDANELRGTLRITSYSSPIILRRATLENPREP